MPKNVGGIDRIIRVIIGAALIAGFFIYRDMAYSWLMLIGIVPLLTGLLGTCWLYSLLGLNTCPMKKG